MGALKYFRNIKKNILTTKSWKNHPKKLHTYSSWEFFFSAAPPAQNSPELHFRFINFSIQPSLLESLVQAYYRHRQQNNFDRYFLNLWHHRVWQRNVGKETTSKLEIVIHSSYCHQLILVQDVLTKLSNYTFRKKNLKKFSRFRIQHWQKPNIFFLIRWKIVNRIWKYDNKLWFEMKSTTQWLCYFKTISGHFFGNFINISHKNKILVVMMGPNYLNPHLINNYDIKHNFVISSFFQFCKKKN